MRGKHLVLLILTIILTLTVVIAAFSEKKQQLKREASFQTLRAEGITQVPSVTSKVKDLEITDVSIIRQGTPRAALAINVTNNSDSAVLAFELTSGNKTDFTSLGIDGLENPDKPVVQIPPHTLKTFEWELSSIIDGSPISLSAARFADGKEEGDARDLEIMHKDRVNSRLRREAAQSRVAPQ
jgi:hypothetical protein